MSVKMILLGFLQKDSLHGYELKQLIEERMGDWADIKFGSIYFALKKLAEDDFLIAEEKMGQPNRPAKIIYTITDKGRVEFYRLLHENWEASFHPRFSFDMGLFFEDYLSEKWMDEKKKLKIQDLERALEYVEDHRKKLASQPEIPPSAIKIISHTLFHLRAERDWLLTIK